MIAVVSWVAFASGVLIGYLIGSIRDPRGPAAADKFPAPDLSRLLPYIYGGSDGSAAGPRARGGN